jgi:type I protein arginine methyltransferase
MYSLLAYGEMMRDRVRMDAYATALRRAVAPGAVVADIGTGTGVLALLACRYGARRVYAIEASEAIEAARDIARANGLADRIQFIQARSTGVTLPEAADVVVSDLHGVLPLFEHHLPSIVDARTRFLRRDGLLIPGRDVVWVTVAGAPALYEPYVTPWQDNHDRFDLSVVRPLVTNTWRQCHARAEHLRLEPRRWAVLDFATLDDPDVTGMASWTVPAAGTAHGLVLWFDADLGNGVTLSNAPGAPEAVYGQAFFPWPDPVALAVGDAVSVSLTATLVSGDYVWTWSSGVREGGGSGRVKAEFRQSTFFGAPLSRATLARRSADHVPALSEEGRVDLFILQSLDAHVPLGRIAGEVLARFPSRCPSWQAALTRVADLSAAYSR